MGLCCERAVEDKGNPQCKYRWPSGSSPQHDSKDSDSSGRRESFNDTLYDVPDVFEDEEEENEESVKGPGAVNPPNSCISNHLQVSNILGYRKNSRTSVSSGRSSVVSILSVQSATQAPRKSSLSKPDEDEPRTELTSSLSVEMRRKPRRAVSLRLPSRYRRKSQENETNIPTIYVDDPPCRPASAGRRKSSLQMALSLFSLSNSLSEEPPVKPVQKILRQPQRRHHVRGISGLSIEADTVYRGGRRQTLYYQPVNYPM